MSVVLNEACQAPTGASNATRSRLGGAALSIRPMQLKLMQRCSFAGASAWQSAASMTSRGVTRTAATATATTAVTTATAAAAAEVVGAAPATQATVRLTETTEETYLQVVSAASAFPSSGPKSYRDSSFPGVPLWPASGSAAAGSPPAAACSAACGTARHSDKPAPACVHCAVC